MLSILQVLYLGNNIINKLVHWAIIFALLKFETTIHDNLKIYLFDFKYDHVN